MTSERLKIESLLKFVQQASIRHKTNPYQIAKATGISLRSVQKLLKQVDNPTLTNIDLIIAGLGFTLHAERSSLPLIKPGEKKSP